MSPRAALLGLLAGLAVVSGDPRARALAQACHGPQLDADDVAQHPLRASLGALFGTFGDASEGGNYVGLVPGFGYRHPWFRAELSLPAYRLVQGERVAYGIGDLGLLASFALVRAHEGELTLGVQLPATLPTGEEGRGLGMGHVMLMPALYFAWAREPFALRAEAGYGRALGDAWSREAGHHHHQGSLHEGSSTPIVNPMNRSELEHALTLALMIQRHTRVHARWFGALPVADERGLVRQIVGLGGSLLGHGFELTSELQLPAVGSPFDVKVILEAAALF